MMKLNLDTIRECLHQTNASVLIIAQRDGPAWRASIALAPDIVSTVNFFCGVPVIIADIQETVTMDYDLTIRRVF